MPPGIWRTSWKDGPAADRAVPGATVVVSVTEFVTHRPFGTPGVAAAGMRLRRSWPETPGAVGIRLWTDTGPRLSRSGSVTVWTDHEHLMRFVARPDHMRIARTYRNRGVMRSATWETQLTTAPPLSPLWASALRILTGAAPWT